MRSVMGVSTDATRYDVCKQYSLTAIKENVALLLWTAYCKTKEGTKLQVKADSFVVEMHVHFPTDLNFFWDLARKCIDIADWFALDEQVKGFTLS
jgi:hypothetical protein